MGVRKAMYFLDIIHDDDEDADDEESSCKSGTGTGACKIAGSGIIEVEIGADTVGADTTEAGTFGADSTDAFGGATVGSGAACFSCSG